MGLVCLLGKVMREAGTITLGTVLPGTAQTCQLLCLWATVCVGPNLLDQGCGRAAMELLGRGLGERGDTR